MYLGDGYFCSPECRDRVHAEHPYDLDHGAENAILARAAAAAATAQPQDGDAQPDHWEMQDAPSELTPLEPMSDSSDEDARHGRPKPGHPIRPEAAGRICANQMGTPL